MRLSLALIALVLIFPLVSPILAEEAPFVATQVIDLNTEVEDVSSYPHRFFYDEALNITFFVASEPRSGRELWRTDGTEEGTKQVLDLCPGPCSSSPNVFTSFDGRVYFTADDGDFGTELWSTDGTAGGTKLVRDLCTGPCSGMERSKMAVFQDRLVMTARAPEMEIWASDGSSGGTSPLLSLDPEACPIEPNTLIPAGNNLFFRCFAQLFRIDAEAKTVHTISQPVGGSVAAVGNDLYFRLGTPEFGDELWRSDGTPEGTEMVMDFCPGDCSGILQVVGAHEGQLYFTARSTGYLYRLNGATSQLVVPEPLKTVTFAGEQLYLHTNVRNPSGDWRTRLWKAGNTSAGTSLLREMDFQPNIRTHAFGTSLFFTGLGGMWFSDGTPEGTYSLEIDANTFSGLSGNAYGSLEEGVVFLADQGEGFELWSSDGTPSGTGQVLNLAVDPGSGTPEKLTPIGDRLVWTPKSSGRPWSTDGTEEGSFSIDQGPQNAGGFFDHNGELFYGASIYSVGDGLWATDGFSTRLVVEGIRGIEAFAAFPNEEQFLVEAGSDSMPESGAEAWVSDLTDGGTEFLAEISPGFGGVLSPPIPLSADIRMPTKLRQSLVFAAGWGSVDLWTSDGTPGGTHPLLECTDGPCSKPDELTRSRQKFIVFSAFDEEKGRELWRTDGTVQGTRVLADLKPGSEGSSPHHFTGIRLNRTLFFARSGEGESLWKANGRVNGTKKIVSLDYQGAPSFVTDSEQVRSRIFFVAINEHLGSELWVSNGTAAGTHLVRELIEGPEGSSPQGLTAYGKHVLFTARDAETGMELWMSDGTAEGTVRLTDIAPGPDSSTPSQIRVVGEKIYFSADDGENGRELWVLSPQKGIQQQNTQD